MRSSMYHEGMGSVLELIGSATCRLRLLPTPTGYVGQYAAAGKSSFRPFFFA